MIYFRIFIATSLANIFCCWFLGEFHWILIVYGTLAFGGLASLIHLIMSSLSTEFAEQQKVTMNSNDLCEQWGDRKYDQSGKINIILICFMTDITFCVVTLAHCLSHPVLFNKDYVQAIVGEASNQTEDTMICVAHALRNRGTLKGVYGYTARHVWSENDFTWRKAWIAWDLSAHESYDPVHGAQNFGTFNDKNILSHIINGGSLKAHCGDLYFY